MKRKERDSDSATSALHEESPWAAIPNDALHHAARHGHTETVVALLDKGASVDAKDNDGETALHIAAWHGRTEIVVALLDRGASVDAKNNRSYTALNIAALKGHTETVVALLDKGASVDAKDNDGQTALHIAAAMWHTQTVVALLDRGASVDAKNNRSYTALHLAAEMSRYMKTATETAVALFSRGAEPFRDPGSMAQLYTMLAAGGEGTHLDEARKDMDAVSAHKLFAKLLNPENDLSDHPNSSVVELYNLISGKHHNLKDLAEAVKKRQTLEKDKLPWQQPEVSTLQIQFGVKALVAREMKALEKQIEADRRQIYWQELVSEDREVAKSMLGKRIEAFRHGKQERHTVREELAERMAAKSAQR